MDGLFSITNLQREELKEAGFDISNVTDEQMAKLSSDMAANYCRHLFWDDLENVALDMWIPILIKINRL